MSDPTPEPPVVGTSSSVREPVQAQGQTQEQTQGQTQSQSQTQPALLQPRAATPSEAVLPVPASPEKMAQPIQQAQARAQGYAYDHGFFSRR